jgi:WD40 repeat protein
VTGNLVLKLEGHEEEVLDFKLLNFEGDTYILSAGQDGKIIKWRVAKNFRFVKI